MKTRILHTKFWSDSYILDLTLNEKLVYLFLLTNEKVNMHGIYEIAPIEISMYTTIPVEEIKKIAKKFQEDKKLFFWKGWVVILNHDKYNCYGIGEKQNYAFIRENSYIPTELWDALKAWDTSIYTSMYTSRHTRLNTEYIIPNKENISISDKDLDEIAKNIAL